MVEGGGRYQRGPKDLSPPLLQYAFLIQFLYKTDADPLWRTPSSFSRHPLFSSYSRLKPNGLLAAHLLLVVVAYANLV